MRTLLLKPRSLRSLPTVAAARRAYASIPTKDQNPTTPLEPSREQAMPIGAFYEAILNTPQPIPDVKPEEPASSVKEAEAAAEASKEPAKRGRKPKPKPEPAATATAATTPTASPAATATATAKEAAEAAAKSSVSTTSPGGAAAAAPAAGLSSSSSSSSTSSPNDPTPNTQEKPKVIFGSSLAGPAERAERLARIRSRSKVVAGVVVPPRPEEPDNCCMSGCVNCVWDRFRDEMEEWVVASAEAERRLAAAGRGAGDKGAGAGAETPSSSPGSSSTESPSTPLPLSQRQQPAEGHVSGHNLTVSMDDDGGGSETNWDVGSSPAPPVGPRKLAKDLWDDELYKNVPVGIREFMKQEKRLKEKHMREGTSAG